MKLRDYQERCCQAITDAIEAGNKRILAVLATGLGKTIIFAHIAEKWRRENRGRVLVICPSIELVHQAAAKIEAVTGIAPSIEQGSNWSDESEWFTPSEFVVSCKASLVSRLDEERKRYHRFKDIGLIVVDEAHLSATAQYAEIIDHFGCPVLGVTATPNRHDGVALKELYDTGVFNYGIKEAIDDGWLVGCQARCIELQSLDLSAVGTNKSDFVQSQLGKVMADDETVFEVAEVAARESRGEKTIVFTSGVDQAMKTAGVLEDVYGVRSAWVCGNKSRVSDSERRRILDSFTQDPDGIQIVCNVGVLTTGFDFPGLKHIVMARPTKSTSLFTQIFGRGTRALEGVVDFDGSTPSRRKERIAASGKPHFRFTDLRDTSLMHKLVTPVDILGGHKPIEAQEAAKQILEEAEEDRDLSEVLEEAEERVKQQEAAERARLAKLRVKAKYDGYFVDPFLDNVEITVSSASKVGRKSRMPFGKHKGTPVDQLPRGYLWWLVNKADLSNGWLKEAVNRRWNQLQAGG